MSKFVEGDSGGGVARPAVYDLVGYAFQSAFMVPVGQKLCSDWYNSAKRTSGCAVRRGGIEDTSASDQCNTDIMLIDDPSVGLTCWTA